VRIEVESFIYYYAQVLNGFFLSHCYVVKVYFVFPLDLGSPMGYHHFGLLLVALDACSSGSTLTSSALWWQIHATTY
jgi:hypothetical protein